MQHIAIFASGSGSNAEQIMAYFRTHPGIRVTLVLSNKPQAAVLEKAARANVPTYVFDRRQFYETNDVLQALQAHQVNWVVLAGFLWLVPENLIEAYPSRIINIHPALLPKFGGKGMYGMHVHQAVVEAGEKTSGITIHRIDGQYDRGETIFQAQCDVARTDTPADVARKVQQLEHEYFAPVIERVILADPL